jgi:hypothetical protein
MTVTRTSGIGVVAGHAGQNTRPLAIPSEIPLGGLTGVGSVDDDVGVVPLHAESVNTTSVSAFRTY